MKKWLLLACFCILAVVLSGGEATMKQNPDYLYKILSTRLWKVSQNQGTVTLSAEDDAFIHFSTEEQLEKIISKYWSEAKEFVILKIDVSQLKGNLVHETNPGGQNKYYHLYQGYIPFSAIVEAKIVFREHQSTETKEHLEIIQIGDPVLRKTARELSREEILSKEIQQLIENMKNTMKNAPGVGLAAPQIGKSIQLIVIEDIDHSHLTPKQIAERKRYPVPFHVVINPKIFFEENAKKVEFFEGCLSVPNFIGRVPRAESVRVECLNERAEPVVINAKGWYARILQHEIDHLKGTLYVDRVQLPTLTTDENYIKFWK